MNVRSRTKLIVLLCTAVLLVSIFFPFRTTVVPEWRIVVVDGHGNAIPALTVSQYWQDVLVADSESSFRVTQNTLPESHYPHRWWFVKSY